MSFKNDKQIGSYQVDGKKTFYVKKSIIDLYAERSKDVNLSLYQFVKNWRAVHLRGESILQERKKLTQDKLVVD